MSPRKLCGTGLCHSRRGLRTERLALAPEATSEAVTFARTGGGPAGRGRPAKQGRTHRSKTVRASTSTRGPRDTKYTRWYPIARARATYGWRNFPAHSMGPTDGTEIIHGDPSCPGMLKRGRDRLRQLRRRYPVGHRRAALARSRRRHTHGCFGAHANPPPR
jgi:hypothetical protein